MIDKITGNRGASDTNPYLISMWVGLSNGWMPPEEISRDLYNKCRDVYNKLKFNTSKLTKEQSALIGYVGFNGSYGGRFYDGGYAGITKTKQGKERNYPKEAYSNVMKQIETIKGVEFLCANYKDLNHPSNSIIYCDPPYNGTKEYKSAIESGFNSGEFWEWCRNQTNLGHTVFISEYSAPEDFICIWSQVVKSSLSANGLIGGSKTSVEKLFIHKSLAHLYN
jgi:DNA adenine methylase